MNTTSEHAQTESHCYRAYGLNLRFNIAIPGFHPCTTPLERYDISLEISDQPPSWFLDAQPLDFHLAYSQPTAHNTAEPAYTLRIWGEDRFFDLTYSDGGRFIIDIEGACVWGQSSPLNIDEVAVYLRGPIMGFLLRRRGVPALHGCAVSIQSRAVVFCGPSESGKSTTAAALALRGIPVLSDDVTPLRQVASEFYVDPGYPRVCLWPDIVEPLMGGPSKLPKLTSNWEKCYLPLDSQKASFATESQRIGIVYMIAPRVEDATAPRIEQISSPQALLQLIQNTYMNWFLNREQRAAELDVLARLAQDVPVRRLVPHASSGRIAALSDLILRDAHQVSSASIFAKI